MTEIKLIYGGREYNLTSSGANAAIAAINKHPIPHPLEIQTTEGTLFFDVESGEQMPFALLNTYTDQDDKDNQND